MHRRYITFNVTAQYLLFSDHERLQMCGTIVNEVCMFSKKI